MMSSQQLSPSQLRALLDILTHYETYAEAESFKGPEAIASYGYPFRHHLGDEAKSSSPLLQLLLTRLVLPTPGVRDLAPEFWSEKFQGIMEKLGEVELSESYDKASLGSRKTLATVVSVVHEAITRGLLGGVPRVVDQNDQSRRDSSKAEDLLAAWDDAIQQAVYGELVDELFTRATETSDFEGHSQIVRLSVDYAIIQVATLLHYMFVLSAEGQYLLKLIENTHKLIPYSLIAQTLRVSNAATMTSAMVKLFLAKMSIGSLTNWIGLTQGAADGMNLLQRIISLVLDWDAGDFRKASDKIKKCKKKVNTDHLSMIDEHILASRTTHDSVRQRSMEQNESIITTIFESSDLDLAGDISETEHDLYMEYYAARLSTQDREKIIQALCWQNPDLFTAAVREVVYVFEPMLRNVHDGIDLRKYISFFQTFLDDFIQTSKSKKSDNRNQDGSTPAPSVEDYVALLRRHKTSLFIYLHDLANHCPNIREKFRESIRDKFRAFRRTETSADTDKADIKSTPPDADGAGSMSEYLQSMFSKLPPDTRQSILVSLDAHDQYLNQISTISASRMQKILNKLNSESGTGMGSMSGPGIYLARWQSLLNETVITPETPSGPLRHGKDVKHSRALGKTGAVSNKDTWDADALSRQEEMALPDAPDVRIVVDALGPQFKELVAEISSRGLR